jgi:hypothetical protein
MPSRLLAHFVFCEGETPSRAFVLACPLGQASDEFESLSLRRHLAPVVAEALGLSGPDRDAFDAQFEARRENGAGDCVGVWARARVPAGFFDSAGDAGAPSPAETVQKSLGESLGGHWAPLEALDFCEAAERERMLLAHPDRDASAFFWHGREARIFEMVQEAALRWERDRLADGLRALRDHAVVA